MYALLLAYNADESSVLRLVLQRAGFATKVTTDIKQAIQEWDANPLDLILFSFQNEPPDEVIQEIRSKTEVPLIVISQPLGEDAHVNLLEVGVDLVVFRPFSARLLISQLRGLLRRASGISVFNLPGFRG